jgi:hypothetical protein
VRSHAGPGGDTALVVIFALTLLALIAGALLVGRPLQ